MSQKVDDKQWPPRPTNLLNFAGDTIEGIIQKGENNSQLMETGCLGWGCAVVLLLGLVCGTALWNLPWTMALPILIFLMLLASLAMGQASRLSPFAYMWSRSGKGGDWGRVIRVTLTKPDHWKNKICSVELRVPASEKLRLEEYDERVNIWARGKWQRTAPGGLPRFVASQHHPTTKNN